MKKTIKVDDFIRLGNKHILNCMTREQREAVKQLISGILLKNCSYPGFLYVDKEGKHVPYIEGVTDETMINFLLPRK